MKTQTLKKRKDAKMDDNRDDNLKFSSHPFLSTLVSQKCNSISGATVNQHPPVHHPLDAHYYSVVDELQLS
jgi:hypothetical protein